ncbi:hypothetical protein GGR57DRAFT_509609 [Xylariaceae sp. FL1272]|nr:hypothetical protein GGR57DRAFT_509609 [Xylariaceae sp. FL1272]
MTDEAKDPECPCGHVQQLEDMEKTLRNAELRSAVEKGKIQEVNDENTSLRMDKRNLREDKRELQKELDDLKREMGYKSQFTTALLFRTMRNIRCPYSLTPPKTPVFHVNLGMDFFLHIGPARYGYDNWKGDDVWTEFLQRINWTDCQKEMRRIADVKPKNSGITFFGDRMDSTGIYIAALKELPAGGWPPEEALKSVMGDWGGKYNCDLCVKLAETQWEFGKA